MATSVNKLSCRYILFISGDIPKISPSSLNRFIDITLDYEADASSIVWGRGAVETLIQFHKHEKVAGIVSAISSSKRRDIARPSDLLRASYKLLLIHAKNITEDPTTFSNVNTRDDLIHLRPRSTFHGYVKDNIILEGEGNIVFWLGVKAVDEERYLEAMNYHIMESKVYLDRFLTHLAGHCLMDASKMALKAGLGEDAENLRRRATDILSRI